MSIGFFLDMESPTPGVGFVNPHPLPTFPAGLTKLHRLFKTGGKSNVNRITRQPGDLLFSGVQFDDDQAFSANRSQAWSDLDGAEYVGGAWTYAFIFDLDAVNLSTNIVISSDFSGSGRRGFRLTAAPSGSRDMAMQTRAYSASGEATATLSVDLPATRFALAIARFDGTTAITDFPSFATPRSSGTVIGDPGDAPLTTSGIQFPQIGSEGDPTNIGYAAYAAWGRMLSDAETDTAIAALYSWARGLGIDV